MGNVQHPGHVHHAPPVGSVDQHEQFAIRWNARREHGFNAEGATALHQDGLIVGIDHASNFQQLSAHIAHAGDKFSIARTEITQHGLFYRSAGGQWAGSE